MDTTSLLPETVLRDLQLYLAEGETIRKTISSASGLVGRLGELWMVLSDRAIYFHTREYGKEAVVALLPRRDIDSILYFQSKRGYTLTFTPRSAPQNITRVSFPREQRDPLEDFCEELADIIEFQAEGHPPIKPGEPLLTAATDGRPPAPPIPPITTVSTVPAIGSARPPSSPAPAEATPADRNPSPPVTPGVRLAKPMGLPASSGPGLDAPAAETTLPPVVKLASGEGPGVKYTVVATAVSLAVGFLWYRLFRALEDVR